jgi:hypothetical protein
MKYTEGGSQGPPLGSTCVLGTDAIYADTQYYSWDKSAEKIYTTPETLLKGEEAQGKDQCFMRMASKINSQSLCYSELGPNSNSVVYTELLKCGIPLKTNKLYSSAQGWGIDLLPYIFP